MIDMQPIADAIRLCDRVDLMSMARAFEYHRSDAENCRGVNALLSALMWAALDELRERDRLVGEMDERMTYGGLV